MRLLICITGEPGAGKSSISTIARELGIGVISMGDIVRKYVKKKYGYLNSNLIIREAKRLREVYGESAIAMLTVKRIKESNLTKEEVLVIDGIRSIEELIYFKKNICQKTLLIYVLADLRTRYRRILKRARADDTSKLEKFLIREQIEKEFGLVKLLSEADYFIVNKRELKNVLKEVLNLFKNLVKGIEEDK